MVKLYGNALHFDMDGKTDTLYICTVISEIYPEIL